MSVEDFRLQLVCQVPGNAVVNTLVGILGFVGDGVNPEAERLFVFRDGKHVIEAAVSTGKTREEVVVVVRFALCNEASIDQVFLNVVQQLRILPAVPIDPNDDNATISAEIADERAGWQHAFGRETAPLSCSEALHRFVLSNSDRA